MKFNIWLLARILGFYETLIFRLLFFGGRPHKRVFYLMGRKQISKYLNRIKQKKKIKEEIYFEGFFCCLFISPGQ